MPDVENPAAGTALVPDAHRSVRSLDRSEGPFAGVLVTSGDSMAVQVDAVVLAGWSGWRFSGAQHVAAPVDVVRRADGHDVLLPWCTDSLEHFVARRNASASVLTAGECTTLVVSLLRGIEELGRDRERRRTDRLDAEPMTGRWWLTDRGRPVFVIGVGGDARAEAADIVELLADCCDDRARARVLSAVRDGLRGALSQPSVPRRLLEMWERDLLAEAAPRHLTAESGALRQPAADVGARPSAAFAHALPSRRSAPRVAGSPTRAARTRAGRVGDAQTRGGRVGGAHGARSLIDRVIERARERMVATLARGPRHPHRGPQHDRPRRSAAPQTADSDASNRPGGRGRLVVVGGAAAAVVLVGGMLWPNGSSEAGDGGGEAAGGGTSPRIASAAPSDADTGAEVPGTDPVATSEPRRESPAPVPTDGAAVPADGLAGTARSLVRVIADCRSAGDAVCSPAVAEGSAGVTETLAHSADAAAEFTLVDEYGDVAVVRMVATGRPDDAAEHTSASEQMLVLIRQDDEWLVRDVYDVADQP